MTRSPSQYLRFALYIAMATIRCSVALAEDLPATSQQPAEDGGPLELIVPREIPAVRFGDPIYIPLAVRNSGNVAVIAPLFRHYNPDFEYVVRSGNEQSDCGDYGQGMGRGMCHSLPAKSVETTVMMVTIWTPGIGLQFLETGEARIDFTAYVSSHPELPALKATSIVKQRGRDSVFIEASSAFTDSGHDRLVDIARHTLSPAFRDTIGNSLSAARPLTNAFYNGQSPLYWLDFNSDRDESWDATSDFYKEAKAMVHPESALYRMMTFLELRDELRGVNAEPKRTSLETLDAYFELLEQCHQSERHFQIVALNGIDDSTALPYSVREPDLDWAELCKEIRHRLPTYSMYFEYACYSTVSLMGHSGIEPSAGLPDRK